MTPRKPWTPRAYSFTTAPLPKPVFEQLQAIRAKEGVTQRTVVIAGILALIKLAALDPAGLAEVWADARELARR